MRSCLSEKGGAALQVRTMVQCGLFSALICICAWLSVPVGNVVFTMQTFGVFLTLLLLGGKRGTVAVFVYLLLGAVGLPVFSGFRGGIGALLGPTGGYLLGFLVMSLCYWVLNAVFGEKPVTSAVGLCAGLLLCYSFGVCWLAFYLAEQSAGALLLQSVVPYLLPDCLKLMLAQLCARKLKRFVY